MEKRETIAQELCDILVKNRVITEQDSRAMHRSFAQSERDNFIDFLLDEGLVDEDQILQALSEYYQTPSFDVMGYFFDSQLVRQLPKDFMLRNSIIPLSVDGDGILIMVAADPTNPDLLPAIGKYISYDVQFLVGLRRNIEDEIKEFFDKSPTEENQDIDLREERQTARDEFELEHVDDEDIDEELGSEEEQDDLDEELDLN